MNEMSVQELRQSLREKGSNASGSRKQLIKRLSDLYEANSISDSSSAIIKFRVTIFCHKRNEATMLMLAPAPGHKLLSQILSRGSNKFRIRARRAFLSSGLELTNENIEPFVKDGLKVVVTNGVKYEISVNNGTGSPVIEPIVAPDSPIITPLNTNNDDDASIDDNISVNNSSISLVDRRVSLNDVGDSDSNDSFNTDLKVDALDIESESGLNTNDGENDSNSEELYNSNNSNNKNGSTILSSRSSSLLSLASSIPSWLMDRGKSLTLNSSPSQSSLDKQITTPNKPASSRSLINNEKEEQILLSSPSPSNSSICSSSPLTTSLSLSSDQTFPSFSSLSSSASISSSSPLNEDEIVRQLRESVRCYEDSKRSLRRAETRIQKLEREILDHSATQSRILTLESALKESQSKYADTEARLLLASKATEKAVRERDTIKVKHKSVVDQLTKSQEVRTELEISQKSNRTLQSSMESLQGKNMEEKSLTELQTLLSWHQHMLTRTMSVITARIDSEKKQINEKWACKICYEKEISVMLQPCHHAVTCGKCSASITLCPICRRTIGHRDPFYAS